MVSLSFRQEANSEAFNHVVYALGSIVLALKEMDVRLINLENFKKDTINRLLGKDSGSPD
jgi:hypothetical protein